jgi:transcriptional regulator with XRE-family HTH domain
MRIISKRIIALLEELDITQRDLANMINVTETTISRYIHNEREPRTDILLKMAEALHTSIEYLIGKTNSKKPIDISELKHDYVDFAKQLQDNNVSIERAKKILELLIPDEGKQ